MKWFAKTKLSRKKKEKSSKHKKYLVKSDDSVSYRNIITSFFILGIPVFVELFLILNYPEPGLGLIDYPPFYTTIKAAGLLTNFTLLYILFVSVDSKLMKKISILLLLLILYIPACLDLICARVTGALLSNDFMFAIFNTDLRETLLIIQEYFVFILINFAVIVYAFFLKPERRYQNKKYSIFAAVLLICSIFGSDLQSFNKIISAFSAHIEDLKDIDRFSQMPTELNEIKTKSKGKQTYVFVIGESVDRKHMEIYGYDRPTTPHFEKIKNELFVFKDVTTAHVFTSAAVKSMLLVRNNSDQIYSLIQFFKNAGFKTFWFSNQGKVDNFDNSVMRFGKGCNEYAFIHGKNVIYSSESYNLIFEDEQRRLKLWDENLLDSVVIRYLPK